MSEDAGAFAAAMRAAIDRSGRSVDEVAELAGMSRAAVYHLLNGVRQDPNWSTVCALARALKVKTDTFRPTRGRAAG